jgi:threonine synthase
MVTVNEDFYSLRCPNCKETFDEKDTCTTCLKCDYPLDIEYNYDFIKSRLNVYALKNSPISALKYLTFYPILDLGKIVTMNEGGTPLHRCKNLEKEFNLKNLYVKNEGANPTGVFKDRGTLVEITKALEMGAKAVCLASTGNMAASVAAYCTLAKIPCYVLVPEGTPIGKLSQTLSYGARIIQVRGDYSSCARLAVKMAERHGFYLAGDYVFRLEGQKSQAYEIAEQLGWRAPDYVICPVGCGTNLSAIWKGFKELKAFDLIEKLPKLIAVQPHGCDVIVKSFEANRNDFDANDNPRTVCSAVCAGNPLDGTKVLRSIYESEGSAMALSDEEALQAEQQLAKEEAIFVEPSGALPIALVKKLTSQNYFKEDDVVVCIATGNGLKDPKSAVKIIPDPPTIDVDINEVDNYLNKKLYLIQSEGMKNKDKELWKEAPSKEELAKVIEAEFGVNITNGSLDVIHASVEDFAQKGKALQKLDLQNIVETNLEDAVDKPKFLEIVDFEAKTSRFSKASAKIKLRHGDKDLTGESEGVGAVDALISAIQDSIKDHDEVSISLTDYNVEIYTGGVAATVKVTMSACDKFGNKVIAHSTSPDVIVASVTAFEKCYNFLFYKNNPLNHG